MDKWLLGVVLLVVFASFFVIFTRVVKREETKDKKLSADDFEILE
ncbi:MAG: hypothetical protein WC827_02240 [Candidatus Paceibacterota bacterium]|jgi:hypothetical protein